MRSFLRKIAAYTYKPYVQYKTSRTTTFRYQDIELLIPPEVFHPGYFNSTRFLLDYISTLPLNEKTFLELGCGSGLISCVAAKHGAKVTASDINTKALFALQENIARNNLQMEIIESDLFDDLHKKFFDIIVINPPYYPKDAKTIAEQAWYCGTGFEYFQKLFSQLPAQITQFTAVYMVLSDDCDMPAITKLAAQQNLYLQFLQTKKFWNGKETIYSITHRK